MASVSIKFVVSFSSQDEVHKVQNLFNGSGCQKWLSNSQDKTGQLEAIFQLDDFIKIAFIDVGTIWCSTVEIQVGRSDWPQDKQYLTLCPTASLMTPIDCRHKQHINKTRMFSTDEFIDIVVKEKWDRIKLILRQPYRKDVQFGVSYIKVKSATMGNNVKPKLGLSPLNNNGRVKMIKSHFFGSESDREPEEEILKEKLLKLSSTGENGSSELTRTAKLVLAASETTNRIYSPSHGSKENSSTARRGLFSESIARKSAPKLEDEIVKFLFDQKLSPEDLDIITVADLRHKLEKIKRRKLNSEEKKVFMNYCQSYLVEIIDGNIVPDEKSEHNSNLDRNTVPDEKSEHNSNLDRNTVPDEKSEHNSNLDRNTVPDEKSEHNSNLDRNTVPDEKSEHNSNLDRNTVPDEKSEHNSNLHRQQRGDICSSTSKTRTDVSVENSSNTRRGDNKDSRSWRNITNISNSRVSSVNSPLTNTSKRLSDSTSLLKNSNVTSVEDDSIEFMLSENTRLLNSASKSSRSTTTNFESENVNFGDFDICDLSETEDDLEDILNANGGFSTTHSDKQRKGLTSPKNSCIISQIKNCVDASSCKKLVTIHRTNVLTPSRLNRDYCDSVNTPLQNSSEAMNMPSKDSRDTELIAEIDYRFIMSTPKTATPKTATSKTATPKTATPSQMSYSNGKIREKTHTKTVTQDDFPSTSKTPSSVRKRKRSKSDVYVCGEENLVSSDKKVRGKGGTRAKGREQNDNNIEINDSGSKKGRRRAPGRGHSRKSSQDSPILLTDDVWLNKGGGQRLGSTPSRKETPRNDESECRLLPCSICNVKIKDYLLDHHFIQCSARIRSAQLDIPPLPDFITNQTQDTSGRGHNKSKSNISKWKNSVTSQPFSTDSSNNVISQRCIGENRSIITEQDSYMMPSSPTSENVLVSDSEEDLELLIPTLQDVLVQCPICSEMFPTEIINVHTNACLDQSS